MYLDDKLFGRREGEILHLTFHVLTSLAVSIITRIGSYRQYNTTRGIESVVRKQHSLDFFGSFFAGSSFLVASLVVSAIVC